MKVKEQISSIELLHVKSNEQETCNLMICGYIVKKGEKKQKEIASRLENQILSVSKESSVKTSLF